MLEIKLIKINKILRQTMKTILKTIVISSVAALYGCASIVSDSTYPLSLNSNPLGSSFTITNKNGQLIHSGNTPATVTLKSGAGYFSGEKYFISLKKPGFEASEITVDTSLDGWYIGNILFGGLIGMLIIDPITGAMWKLPETASAQLSQKLTSNELTKGQFHIVSIDDVPFEFKGQLQEL